MRECLQKQLFELTPVVREEGLFLKLDDSFQPFGPGTINGGKLRQCAALLLENYDLIFSKHGGLVVNGCGVHSPQGVIVAALCRALGMQSQLFIGGGLAHPMPKLAREWGAEIVHCPSGRNSVLYSRVRKSGGFVVAYGINLMQNRTALLDSVSYQVQNLPDDLDNLVITCGSGITSSGVLWGLHKYGKKVSKVYLVGNAPSREKLVQERLSALGFLEDGKLGSSPLPFVYVDRFSEVGFAYERGLCAKLGNRVFHPNYEAKAFDWMRNCLDWSKEKTLFWIVGNNEVFSVPSIEEDKYV